MSINLVNLKVEKSDKDKLMKECIDALLQENPDLEGMKLSQRYMFKRLINFYLKKD